jgi:hypothetical protein
MKKRPLDKLVKIEALEMLNKFQHKWTGPIIRKITISLNFEFDSGFSIPSEEKRKKNKLERKRKNKIKANFKRNHII